MNHPILDTRGCCSPSSPKKHIVSTDTESVWLMLMGTSGVPRILSVVAGYATRTQNQEQDLLPMGTVLCQLFRVLSHVPIHLQG